MCNGCLTMQLENLLSKVSVGLGKYHWLAAKLRKAAQFSG